LENGNITKASGEDPFCTGIGDFTTKKSSKSLLPDPASSPALSNQGQKFHQLREFVPS